MRSIFTSDERWRPCVNVEFPKLQLKKLEPLDFRVRRIHSLFSPGMYPGRHSSSFFSGGLLPRTGNQYSKSCPDSAPLRPSSLTRCQDPPVGSYDNNNNTFHRLVKCFLFPCRLIFRRFYAFSLRSGRALLCTRRCALAHRLNTFLWNANH